MNTCQTIRKLNGKMKRLQRACGSKVYARRLVFAASIGALVALSANRSLAQDRVVVRNSETGVEQARSGVILDYQSRFLELETVSGRSVKIPAREVIRVEAEKSEKHLEADQLINERRYVDAFDAYTQALSEESRVWVQRELVAKRIAIARLLGNSSTACNDFLRLTRTESEHRYWGLIPIPWGPESPDTLVARDASDWLASEQPLERLLGAAWLLNTPSRSDAEQTLRELSRSQQNEIGQIASVQLWRVKPNPNEADLISWQATNDELPEALRAGPTYLLGRALQQQSKHQQAAIAFLQVRILHKEVLALSPMSLFESARSLEQIGKSEEAQRLYFELREGFPDSEWTARIPN